MSALPPVGGGGGCRLWSSFHSPQKNQEGRPFKSTHDIPAGCTGQGADGLPQTAICTARERPIGPRAPCPCPDTCPHSGCICHCPLCSLWTPPREREPTAPHTGTPASPAAATELRNATLSYCCKTLEMSKHPNPKSVSPAGREPGVNNGTVPEGPPPSLEKPFPIGDGREAGPHAATLRAPRGGSPWPGGAD